MMIVVALFLTRRRPLGARGERQGHGVPKAYMYLIIERLAPYAAPVGMATNAQVEACAGAQQRLEPPRVRCDNA